jgi:hypothetical protein
MTKQCDEHNLIDDRVVRCPQRAWFLWTAEGLPKGWKPLPYSLCRAHHLKALDNHHPQQVPNYTFSNLLAVYFPYDD